MGGRLYSFTGKLKRLDEKPEQRQGVDREDAARHPEQGKDEALFENFVVRDVVVPYAAAEQPGEERRWVFAQFFLPLSLLAIVLGRRKGS